MEFDDCTGIYRAINRILPARIRCHIHALCRKRATGNDAMGIVGVCKLFFSCSWCGDWWGYRAIFGIYDIVYCHGGTVMAGSNLFVYSPKVVDI